MDEGAEDSKNAPGYDPFSGGQGPKGSSLMQSSIPTMISGGGKKGRKRKGGGQQPAAAMKGGFY